MESASELAAMLRSGSLPVDLSVVEEKIIGPTLGEGAVNSGKIATSIALLTVCSFMFALYDLWGLFADLALVVNLVMIMGLMSVVSAALTLSGVAGIVLTLGM